jgi:DNA modification methylase
VEGLRYLCLIHYIVNGGRSSLTERRGVISCAKPVLVYAKGGSSAKPKRIFTDLVQTAPLDRKANVKLHPHEQDVRGFEELVKRFSEPGDTVLDMCCGSGTTGVACVHLKRKFVGVDIDAEHIETARKRLSDALKNRVH